MNKEGKIQSRFFTGHYSMAEVNSKTLAKVEWAQFVWQNTNGLDENPSRPWKIFMSMTRTRKLKIKLHQKNNENPFSPTVTM